MALFTFLAVSGRGAGKPWYVMNVDPPSAIAVDLQEYKILAQSPLDANPSHALLGPDGRYLYILHNGAFDLVGKALKQVSTLAILDTSSMKVTKTIPLGWRVHKMAFSKEKRYLVCLTTAKSEGKNSAEEPEALIVVDTGTNEVIARRSKSRTGVKFKLSTGAEDVTADLLYTGDLSRIFLYDSGIRGGKKVVVGASITVFSLNREEPQAEIPFDYAGHFYTYRDDDHRSFLTLSPDEKWLYVVESGKMAARPKDRQNGRVHVVDTDSAKVVATYDIGYLPRKPVPDLAGNSILVTSAGPRGEGLGQLYRFRGKEPPAHWNLGDSPQFIQRSPENPGYFVASWDELRILEDGGDHAENYVALRSNKLRDGGRKPVHEIKGIPSPDLLVLPDSGKLIMSIDTVGDKDNFYPDDRIALIDLKKNEVEKVISVGRGGVKVGHFIANLTLTVGLAMASGYAAYSAGSPAYLYPVFGVRGGKSVAARMAASGDGKRAYVLNPGTKDVTAIDTGTGAVLSMIPVGGGCSRMISTPKSRYACVVCDEHIAMVDTQSSEVRLDHRLKNGKVLDAGIDESSKQVIVLTSESLLVFAMDDASLIKEIEGFGKPHLLIRTP